MFVSIVTPTHNREEFLPRLYRCVAMQQHSELEFLVCDDSPTPSAFLTNHRDPRVRYVHLPNHTSTGKKRDLLNQMARGDVIVHFDDDDYYAPTYLNHVLHMLQEADFTKLHGWFNYSVVHKICTYWNTAEIMQGGIILSPQAPPQPVSAPADYQEYVWGFGFSYAYRRSVLVSAQFGDKDFGEDYAFYLQLRAANVRCAKVLDDQGLALHVIHHKNLSRVFGQYRVPTFLLRQTFGANIDPFL